MAAGLLQWREWLWIVAAVVAVSAWTLPARSTSEPAHAAARNAVHDWGTDWTLVLLGTAGLIGSTATSVFPPFLADGLVAQGQSPGVASVVLAIAGWLGLVARVGGEFNL